MTFFISDISFDCHTNMKNISKLVASQLKYPVGATLRPVITTDKHAISPCIEKDPFNFAR